MKNLCSNLLATNNNLETYYCSSSGFWLWENHGDQRIFASNGRSSCLLVHLHGRAATQGVEWHL